MPKFVLTIDVEGRRECRKYDTVGVLHRFLDDLSLPATLFVTPDVLDECAETINRWMGVGHHIGVHIHPERLEPGHSKFLTDHTTDEIYNLVSLAKDVFESRVDTDPCSFRAGRWSYEPRLLNVLSSLGFKYDSSLRPDTQIGSFSGFGMRELPLSAISNTIIRKLTQPREIDSVPFALDAVLDKRSTALPFWLLSEWIRYRKPEYIMVGVHDYDLLDDSRRYRIRRYLECIRQRTNPVTIEEL